MRSTRLARQLSSGTATPGPIDAFKLARRQFLEGRRVEMQPLAAELGVSRATLFRWVGNRDQLHAEILWSLAEPTLRRIIDEATGTGALRVGRVVGAFCRALVENTAFRTYLAREPELALRIVTRNASPVQRRFCDEVEALLADEVAAGHLDPPLAVDDLAYVVVRLSETFTYTNLITGEPPSPEKAEAAVVALLS